MALFCQHDWVLISETTTKSRAEVYAKLGYTKISGSGTNPASRKFIQLLKCVNCGKLKKFVEII